MWNMPMNRWYVSRWLKSATVEDFIQAVYSLSEELEKISGDKFDLKVAFYKAAAPHDVNGEPVKPQVLEKEVTSLKEVSARQYRKSDYVEATLTARATTETPDGRPHFHTAKITAKWPDPRRLTFHVEPQQEQARELCHHTMSYFPFWTRGIDYN